jgi:hypothetical protein
MAMHNAPEYPSTPQPAPAAYGAASTRGSAAPRAPELNAEVREARDTRDARDLGDEPHAMLRAHQVHSCIRAADRYSANDTADDRTTASWLMSTAMGMSAELAADTDRLARRLRDLPGRTDLSNVVAALRKRAYQLQAVTKAADHFLEQDNREDQQHGTWLVATAQTLSHRLAADLDDQSTPPRRTAAGRPTGMAGSAADVASTAPVDAQEAMLARRMAAATSVVGQPR